MIAERRHGTRNALTLIVGLLLLWQIIYLMVGDVALSSPLATFRYTATLVASDTFRLAPASKGGKGKSMWRSL
jgi:NitT/TauT family transport system permease protein